MGYLTWILGLLGALVLGLVKDEISVWLPRLARWCVLRAADRMPDRERWREEWLAHLDECPGKLGQIAHAFGVLTGAWQRERLSHWRLLLEAAYYLPGIRWSLIDRAIDVVGITSAVALLYTWYTSSDLTSTLAAISFSLAIFGLYADRKASKLLPRDLEMIRLAMAYREAQDRK